MQAHPKKAMPSRFSALVFASVSLFALGQSVALAASLAQEQCTSQGGVYDKTTKNCEITTTEHVGNSDNSQTVTTDSSQTAHGNFTNPNTDPATETCSGPGGSTSSSHCN
jgi:hypothetical protein